MEEKPTTGDRSIESEVSRSEVSQASEEPKISNFPRGGIPQTAMYTCVLVMPWLCLGMFQALDTPLGALFFSVYGMYSF